MKRHMKTSHEKRTLVPFHTNLLMFGNFFGIDCKGLCLIKFKNEKENYCLLFTSSIDVKLGNYARRSCATTLNGKEINQKSWPRAESPYCYRYVLLFCRSRWRCLRPRFSSSLDCPFRRRTFFPGNFRIQKGFFWYFFADIPRKNS